ncbi:helix-turn-helix domain-containing protein [Anaerosporobacter sp.]|uniref:helix-turn-helix domain-containing protein n=1 Tax=Anaerosporobacter sp. TaxID=1872529 RepID=UPI00286F3CFF|nr:helix-turn-helix transcriptional regulator [Anaerosporobacter sp.]
MNNEKMGQFILELRKSHQMTQKELAVKLNVSDKAVSKWERGLSCPDISLLSPLSDILGVTTTELLNGERSDEEDMSTEEIVVNALEYGQKTAKRKIELTQSIWGAVFSILLLIGVTVVSIVNVAISGTFTWSLIPISASVFAWLVFFPAIKFGVKGIIGSLISLSLLILPFLYVLDYTINRITEDNNPIFAMSVRIAPLSIAFLWIALLLFKKFKSRKLLVIAFLVLLASPLNFFINFMIAKMLDQPNSTIQTVLNVLISVVVAIILFIIDIVMQKRRDMN